MSESSENLTQGGSPASAGTAGYTAPWVRGTPPAPGRYLIYFETADGEGVIQVDEWVSRADWRTGRDPSMGQHHWLGFRTWDVLAWAPLPGPPQAV